MPAGAGALVACKRLEVQVMWRFLTTGTIFVILLAGSHASPAVAAKAASPHHYQTFRGKVDQLQWDNGLVIRRGELTQHAHTIGIAGVTILGLDVFDMPLSPRDIEAARSCRRHAGR